MHEKTFLVSVLFIMLTKNDIFFRDKHDKKGIEIKYKKNILIVVLQGLHA